MSSGTLVVEMPLSACSLNTGALFSRFTMMVRASRSASSSSRAGGAGVGLAGMTQRCKELAGEFRIQNANPGTLVEIVIPVPAVVDKAVAAADSDGRGMMLNEKWPRLFRLCRVGLIGFDDDIHLSAFFQLDRLAILVFHHVIDANFPVEVVRTLNAYLRLFGLVRIERFDNFLYPASLLRLCFSQ